MKRLPQGQYVTISTTGESAQAFIPEPLPPQPPIDWTPQLRTKFDEALLALGRLDSVATLLPDISVLLYLYMRQEAVLSSMIEGTHSSLSDLLLFEQGQQTEVPLNDVQEVSNYVKALHHGLDLLKEGLPLSLRFFREIHQVLMTGGRGSDRMPGEFRGSQNRIGGSRPGNATFVPPPPEQVLDCMSRLEYFLNDRPEPTPPLLKAALAHVQFETIHPFLDGNGRVGRLMITLLLCGQKVLQEPMLYLSLYFKTHRQRYYELLDQVRLTGDWEAWLEFFAEAVICTAGQAVQTAQQLRDLAEEDRTRIDGLGRATASAHRVHRQLMEYPVATSGWLADKTGLSPATVNKTLRHLGELGIVRAPTTQKRNRTFIYARCLAVMNRGVELPEA